MFPFSVHHRSHPYRHHSNQSTVLTLVTLAIIFNVYLRSSVDGKPNGTSTSETSEPFNSSLDKLSADYASVYIEMLVRGMEYSRSTTGSGHFCHEALRRLIKRLRKNDQTAMRMVDYSGRIPAQSSQSLIDFGYYRQCMRLHSSAYCLITGTSGENLIHSNEGEGGLTWHQGNATIDYLLDLNHHLNVTRKAVLQLGLCLPAACYGPEVESIASQLLSHTNLTIRLDRCEKPETKPIKLSRYEVIALVYLGSLIVSHLMGPCSSSDKPLSAFNVAASWKSFTRHSTRNTEDSIKCIYGLKALCMAALIIGNLQYLVTIPSKYDSLTEAMTNDKNTSDKSYPLIGSPTNSYLHLIDTFFFLSGYLALNSGYSRLRSIKLRKVVFVRCFKFSSMIAATTALYFALFNHFIKSRLAGPLWESFYGARDLLPACMDHWWSDILMIDTWRYKYNHCNPSSWYLVIDLLSFTGSLYFVIPWLEMRIVAIVLTLLSFGTGLIASGFSLYKTHYPSTIVTTQLFTPRYFDFINIFLTKPWIHGVCYMMGILTAFHMRKPRPNLSKSKQKLGTLLFVGSFLLVHWLESTWSARSFNRNTLWIICYGIGARLSWSASFGWIIYLINSQNQLKWVNRFLSHPFFRSLSKLNISLLLTNFLVIRLRNATLQFPVSNSNTTIDWLIYHLAPNLILIYGLSLLLTLTVEIPATRAAMKSSGIPERGGTGRILTRPQIYSDIKVVSNTISSEVAKNGPYQVSFDGSTIHSVKF